MRRVNSKRREELPQGEFISPKRLKIEGPHSGSRNGNGGSDVTKLDDALAAVDNFVAEKLGL